MNLSEAFVLGKREVKTVAPEEFSVSKEAVQGIKDYAKDAHAYYDYISPYVARNRTGHGITYKSRAFEKKVEGNSYVALTTYDFFKELAFQLESSGGATLSPVRSKGLRPKTIDTALIPNHPAYCRIGEKRLNEILGLIYPGRDGYEKQKEVRGLLSKGKTIRLTASKK